MQPCDDDPTVDPLTAPAGFDPTRRFIRVTGQRGDFVEFDFAVGEPDVFAELVLSRTAFEEFCATNQPEPMGPRDEGEPDVDHPDAATWRLSDATSRHL